jgi:hypothetical protein
METTYSVSGKTGHEAKFIVSLINNSGKFKTPLLYRLEGEIKWVKHGNTQMVSPESTRKCTAYAILRETGIEISQTVDIKTAFREKWTDKAGSKWHTMPDEMLQYRSAAFFGKMYCPELTMGLNMQEELEDIQDAEAVEIDQTGKDIFEKGVEVSTEPDPTVDPSNPETIPDAIVVESEPVKNESQETAGNADLRRDTPATEETPTTTDKVTVTGSGEPPTEPKEFLDWMVKRFSGESTAIDMFLQSKKWLPNGGTLMDLSDSWLKNLRGMWDKFLPAYEKFKAELKHRGSK